MYAHLRSRTHTLPNPNSFPLPLPLPHLPTLTPTFTPQSPLSFKLPHLPFPHPSPSPSPTPQTFPHPSPSPLPLSLSQSLLPQQLKVYVSMHAYSQMWMLPWGFSQERPENYKDLYEVALNATSALEESYGTK